MPDDLIPAIEPKDAPSVPTETTDAPADNAEPVSDDSVYDSVADDVLSDDDGDDEDDGVDPAPKASEPDSDDAPQDKGKKPVAPGNNLTDAEKSVLDRAQVPKDQWGTISRAAVDALVNAQQTMDRLQAERGREQQEKPEETKEKPEKKPERAENPDISRVMDELAAEYGDEIKPIGNLLASLDSRNESARQAAQTMPYVKSLVEDIAFEMATQSVMAQYPSADKPEARQQLRQRIQRELAVGDYLKDGVGLLQAVREAASQSARVLFSGVNETAAAADLVSKNKDRLASQPKVKSRAASPRKPKTEDEIYDSIADEVLSE